MGEYEINIEALRKRLLDEAYAGVFSGFGVMTLDISDIECASAEELLEIAKQYRIIP